MKKIKKILIIIQRSNGDVFLSINLINILDKYFKSPEIDLLVNNDTYPIASILPHIKNIHQFSYSKKKNNRWKQEKDIIKKIFRKYDLSINLTASDRSVIYALIASKTSISAIEISNSKSWWKKLLLKHSYYFDTSKHILVNNSQPLNCLQIDFKNEFCAPLISDEIISNVKIKLQQNGIEKFLIFHPSAQYEYKIYPKNLRNQLLENLSTIGIPIVITGSKNALDLSIKKEISNAPNIFNFIGETSLEEYFVLSSLSMAYIGMDTLNMHIAASQNKRIFAIFGSTRLSAWAPWSNYSKTSAKSDAPVQSYDNITIFQSSIPCSLCGIVGCGSNHGSNKFPLDIQPDKIYDEIYKWLDSSSTSPRI